MLSSEMFKKKHTRWSFRRYYCATLATHSEPKVKRKHTHTIRVREGYGKLTVWKRRCWLAGKYVWTVAYWLNHAECWMMNSDFLLLRFCGSQSMPTSRFVSERLCIWRTKDNTSGYTEHELFYTFGLKIGVINMENTVSNNLTVS